ncbi:cytochrome c biogenesis CcdA family protein [Aliiroseovarius crassostreae]|uniref:cytochrome c biogenesis CcdA family protein n=1 Tax=Aliiroseovarius crassostreae TaxID=154981 RepID=UPI0021FAA714|nr:cytochrome c biogenesis CcdA family protein [Aliiroseovarius crassostreae]UWQ04838.1 cytochrome c biogenesis CcdA family protein [Aliiroseovarius crassostreae]
MELVFGYLAGLLTLINPCVLPVLPIVLATALGTHRLGPVILAAGMSLSFVSLGLLVTVLGHTVGLDETHVANAGATLMIGFGLILLVPLLSDRFSTLTSGFSTRADQQLDEIDRASLRGQFLGGALLGAVWSPCIGPTLGGAIALASQGQNLVWATAIMLAFALGVSSIILALGYGARGAIQRRQATLRVIASRARPIMGGVFVVVGAAILLKIHHVIEAWAVDTLPYWLTDLSVSL